MLSFFFYKGCCLIGCCMSSYFMGFLGVFWLASLFVALLLFGVLVSRTDQPRNGQQLQHLT